LLLLSKCRRKIGSPLLRHMPNPRWTRSELLPSQRKGSPDWSLFFYDDGTPATCSPCTSRKTFLQHMLFTHYHIFFYANPIERKREGNSPAISSPVHAMLEKFETVGSGDELPEMFIACGGSRNNLRCLLPT
jgi:hypothetical protein